MNHSLHLGKTKIMAKGDLPVFSQYVWRLLWGHLQPTDTWRRQSLKSDTSLTKSSDLSTGKHCQSEDSLNKLAFRWIPISTNTDKTVSVSSLHVYFVQLVFIWLPPCLLSSSQHPLFHDCDWSCNPSRGCTSTSVPTSSWDVGKTGLSH